ncbi:MAG TPA: hypothetical protein VEW94_01515 [Chloroflexia bacterium]|nr:hypothetical protein [Chloroflexia bacterium]
MAYAPIHGRSGWLLDVRRSKQPTACMCATNANIHRAAYRHTHSDHHCRRYNHSRNMLPDLAAIPTLCLIPAAKRSQFSRGSFSERCVGGRLY